MPNSTAFFHSAMVVTDLDRSMDELARTLGVLGAQRCRVSASMRR